MKLIFRIARTELRNLFYSPIAWFLTIVFFVQCALAYTNMLHDYAMRQEMGGGVLRVALTGRIFGGSDGMFSNVIHNLYLYIPLLTMGLISREVNSGSINLLYSSPVKMREIVFGKYLAMLIYGLLLLAVVAVFMVSGLFNIKSVDTGMLLAAALGFYLLLSAYAAIGLFMSSLSSYQVISAIATFITIGALNYIGKLWQGIDFVRDLTYFLSINGRTQHMLSGLITSKDVIYFIVVVYIFLGLAICKLKGVREVIPVVMRIGQYMAIIVSALLIGYISSRPSLVGYWDTTSQKSNTLTRNAQNIVKELDGSALDITAYVNYLDNYNLFGMPEHRNDYLSRWEPYLRFKPDINFHFVYYYDTAFANGYDMFRAYNGMSMAKIVAQRTKASGIDLSMFQTPDQIHKIIDLKPEANRFVMQLKYKDRSTFLRVFNDMNVWPSETEVAAALKRLTQAKLPKMVFVTGNRERAISKSGEREYKTLANDKKFRYAMINQGFDVDTVSLDDQNIPDSITALVIADPQNVLSATAMAKIQKYINKGGNLLIAGEPGRQSVLNPLLKQFGVQLVNGMLEQPSRDFAASIVLPHFTEQASVFSKSLNRSSSAVSMPGTAGLTFADTNGFHIHPLLSTDAQQSWNSSDRNPDLDLSVQRDENNTGFSFASQSGSLPGAMTSPQSANNNGTNARISAARHFNPSQPMSTPRQVIKIDEPARKLLQAVMQGDGSKEEKRRKVMAIIDSVAKANAMARKGMIASQSTSAILRPATVVPLPPKQLVRPVVLANTGPIADEGVKKSYPVAVALTRKLDGAEKEQRIIIAGDADFMSNAELKRTNIRTNNFMFCTTLFSWLDYGEFPINTSRPEAKDNRVRVSTDGVVILKIVYVWVFPAILLVFGSIILVRRKRK